MMPDFELLDAEQMRVALISGGVRYLIARKGKLPQITEVDQVYMGPSSLGDVVRLEFHDAANDVVIPGRAMRASEITEDLIAAMASSIFAPFN